MVIVYVCTMCVLLYLNLRLARRPVYCPDVLRHQITDPMIMHTFLAKFRYSTYLIISFWNAPAAYCTCIRLVWSHHGYIGSVSPNTNNGSPSSPDMLQKHATKIRLGLRTSAYMYFGQRWVLQ